MNLGTLFHPSLRAFVMSEPKHPSQKPTVKMPITRVDEDVPADERDLPDPNTYRLVKGLVGELKASYSESVAAQREIEAKKASDWGALEAKLAAGWTNLEFKLNNRYNGILTAVQTNGIEFEKKFDKKFAILTDEVADVKSSLAEVRTVAESALQAATDNSKSLFQMSTRVETLETHQARVDRRNDFLAATSPGSIPPWDLGRVTDTGTHRKISVVELEASRAVWEKKLDESLELRDQASKAALWNKSIKWILATLGAVFTAVLIAVIVTFIKAQQSIPTVAPVVEPHSK
jgi:hypothetical protein